MGLMEYIKIFIWDGALMNGNGGNWSRNGIVTVPSAIRLSKNADYIFDNLSIYM